MVLGLAARPPPSRFQSSQTASQRHDVVTFTAVPAFLGSIDFPGHLVYPRPSRCAVDPMTALRYAMTRDEEQEDEDDRAFITHTTSEAFTNINPRKP